MSAETRARALRLLAPGPLPLGLIRAGLKCCTSTARAHLNALSALGWIQIEHGEPTRWRLTPMGAAALAEHESALRARRTGVAA